jgi:predicted DNA binding CopG/RHH family protein
VATNRKTRKKRVNINLDSSLHDRFKAAVAAEGKKMTEVLIDLIHRYLQK